MGPLPHEQSFALRYPACLASSSVPNWTTDVEVISLYRLQLGSRYTLLLRLPRMPPASAAAAA